MLLLKGFNDSLFWLKEFFIDSNYLFKKQHNLELDLAFQNFKWIVLDEKTNSIQADAKVYLINMDGIKIDSSFSRDIREL